MKCCIVMLTVWASPRCFSHLFFTSSTADMWTREPARFIGPRTSRTVCLFVFPSCSSFWLHMQVIYLLLLKSLSAVFFFFWSPSRKSIFVKTEARLYLSIHPSIHPSTQHLEYLRDTSGTVLVTEATKCEESATEITSTMSNDPKQASAIQHLTITLNVWM